MEAPKKVSWSASALKQFDNIYQYIFEESEQNAEKVRVDIFEKTVRASIYPEHFSLEKYKVKNDGSYRYFEMHRIRVSYRILEEQILIVRVRHTSMRPSYF